MRILTAIFILLISLSASAQTKDSVTCIPNAQLRQAVRMYESYKILKIADSLKDLKITLLTAQASNRDSVVSLYIQADSNSQRLLFFKSQQLDFANQKYKLEVNYAAVVEKAYKKERLKLFVVGGIAVVGIVGEFIFLVRK